MQISLDFFMFSILSLKTYRVGTCLNRLDEAVLTSIHDVYFPSNLLLYKSVVYEG